MLLAAVGTAAAVLAATALPASANAANPLPDSSGNGLISGTVLNNADGSVTVVKGFVDVTVGGKWDWGTLSHSSTQATCSSRYGVGWAVDWFGVSPNPIVGTTGLKIKGKKLLFHVTAALDGFEKFTSPCAETDSQGFPAGSWTAKHTYKEGTTVPAKLCVNMYDLHGTPGVSKPNDLNAATNGDNSVRTNAFDPTVGDGYCFTPKLLNASKIVTVATNSTFPASISDTATLSDTFAATGTITFAAFSDNNCATNVFTSAPLVVDGKGNGVYGPVSFVPPAVGKFWWIASYSGDGNNSPASGTCGETGEISTVSPHPDLAVFKSGPAHVILGNNAVYSITVKNTGLVTVANATFTDGIPAGTTLVSAPGCSNTITTITCNVGTLAPGAMSSPVTITLLPGKTGKFINTVVVPTDLTPTDDKASVPTIVDPVPVLDLKVVKTGPASVIVHSNITYGITVTNTGNVDYPNATVTDELPATTIFQSAGNPCVLLGNGHTLSCNVGTLKVGASFGPISYVVKTTQVGIVSNTATVPADSTHADDSSTVPTNVTEGPLLDLKVVKSGPPAVTLGSNITYGLTITNTGNVDYPNATMTDELPATTTFVSAVSPCVMLANGHTLSCNVGTLKVGASFGPISYVVKTGQLGTVTNIVKVPTDGTPTDDSFTVKTVVNPPPMLDLKVVKTGPDSVTLGDDIHYTLTVTNTGNVPYPNATITDHVPATTTFVSVGAPCVLAANVVTCNVGTLAVGASFGPINFVVHTTKVTTVSNTATVPTDGTPTDDTSTVPTVVKGPLFSVHVAYADTVHFANGKQGVPSIWQGSPNTAFVGCNVPSLQGPCTNINPNPTHEGQACVTITGQSPAACYDAGALRFDNNTTSAIPLKSVSVSINGCVFNPWTQASQAQLTIPVNGSLILTQTGGVGPNVGCGFKPDPEQGFNFDTSDSQPGGAARCTQTADVPRIDVNLTGGGTLMFFDTGRVLNTNGLDPTCSVDDAVEFHDWTGAL